MQHCFVCPVCQCAYYSRVFTASVESAQEFEAAIARKLAAQNGGIPGAVNVFFAPSSPLAPLDLLSLLSCSSHLILTCDGRLRIPFLRDAAPPAAAPPASCLHQVEDDLGCQRVCFTVLPLGCPELVKLDCDKHMM
jgi:hypothetical protein